MSKIIDHIKKLWRGELSLKTVFWGWSFFPIIVVSTPYLYIDNTSLKYKEWDEILPVERDLYNISVNLYMVWSLLFFYPVVRTAMKDNSPMVWRIAAIVLSTFQFFGASYDYLKYFRIIEGI
ncbi:MAG TPA: hypothetical protein DEA55_11125 [Rhodospirillaceae bacterium]|nr:hypothetical protein [Rhodospirillaceae bacterium]